MIRLRQSGVDEILIKRVRDWYDPGPGCFFSGVTGVASFDPASLFTTGVNGAWYDPSDITTLYQDAAGTTPVTAVEQPVGKMLDKSGNGNHAFNSSGNSANFPVLSARYNLLTKTEQFDASTVWNRTAAGSTIQGTGVQAVITADYAAGPFSGTLADRVQLNRGTGTTSSDRSGISQLNITTVATQYTAKIYVKPLDSTTDAQLLASNVGILAAGVAATSNDIADIGSGWKLITRVYPNTVLAQSASEFRIQILGNVSPQTMDLLVWGADLRVSNDALNQPAYQRVNTSSDYDTVGFKPYLCFNGTNQWLQTNSIDFAYGDKMFVCAGVRKKSDSTSSAKMFIELSNGATNRRVSIGQNTTTDRIFFASGGDSLAAATSGTLFPAPITVVIAGIGDISGKVARLEVNSGFSIENNASQGSGMYPNAPIYIGSRAGNTFFADANFYGIVVAGKQASASEITNTKTFINQKTGAY